MSSPDEMIGIARIIRPQGRRGEVIAELLTNFPDRFKTLRSAFIKPANGEPAPIELQNSWLHKGRVVIKFAGYDDIDEAEKLRDSLLMVTRGELVELPQDFFYEFDLVDSEVVTVDGRPLGKVKRVEDYGAAPLLVVNDGSSGEMMIPLARSICVEIDAVRKRIVVDPPEGLLEL